MSNHGPKSKSMVVDSDVLIDFIGVDRNIVSLIVRHVGPLHVISPVVDQVKDIDEEELIELGMVIIEPELADAFAAAVAGSPIGFEDFLCCLTAKRHGLICVTNDKNLQKRCKEDGVPVRRGLRLLIDLAAKGGVSSKTAIEIAELVHQNNPKYITPEIIRRFKKALGQAIGGSR